MDQTLIIQGMHCDACKSLIRMELEEHGLADKILALELQPEVRGELKLTNTSDTELAEIIALIDALENYSVLTN